MKYSLTKATFPIIAQLPFLQNRFDIWNKINQLKVWILNLQSHTYNFLFLLMFCSITSFSQVATDVISIGGFGPFSDNLKDIIVDQDDNIYIMMQAYQGMEMNGTPLITEITNVARTTITKIDSTNNLIWHKEFNYKFQVDEPTTTARKHMFVDSIGNVYVTDRYSYTFNVFPYSFSTFGEANVTYKLDVNGNLQWAINGGGLMIDESTHGFIELLQYSSSTGSVGGELITNKLGTIVWLDTDGNYIDHIQYDTPDYATEVVMGRNIDGNYFGYRKPLAPNVATSSSFEYIVIDTLGVLINSNLTHYGNNIYKPQSIIHDPVLNTYYNVVQAYDRIPLNSTTPVYNEKLLLLRLDSDFNVIGRLDLSGHLPANSVELFRISFLNGALFLTGIIDILFGTNAWTSLGQSVYLFPEDEKMIISKFTKDLNYLWHRHIPGSHNSANVRPPHVYKNSILFNGTQQSFQMDSVTFTAYPTNAANAYILSVNDTTHNYLQLEGTVFKDQDQNGIFTAVDLVFPYRQIGNDQFSDNIYFTDINGNFNFDVPNNPQTVISKDLPMYWSRSTNDSLFVNPDSLDILIDGLNFGMYPVPGITDMSVEITAITDCVIGTNATYNLDICNIGTDISDGIFFLIQSEYLTYVSSSILPDSIRNDTLFFSYLDLGVLECLHLTVTDSVSNLVEILGDNILISLEVHPEFQDTNYTNNSDFLLHQVTGAYDPNDITVWPSCGITPGFINSGQSLDYRIRFQNTGNAPASFVTIKDTLSSLLDYSTFQFKASSHSVNISIINGVLTLQYDNINLPDSTTDSEGSKGFFKYSIQPLSTIPVGSSILNSAAIFFDFNPPIITNTEVTNIVDPSNLFSISLNPVNCANDGSIVYEGFCVSGGLWSSLNGGSFIFDEDGIIDNLSAGTYNFALSNGYDTLEVNGLVINYEPITTDLSTTICSGDSIYFDGAYQTNTGVYEYTLTTINGCDSLVAMSLLILPFSEGTDIVIACESYTWIDGHTYTASNDTATYTLTNAASCDSVVTLNLTINSTNTGIDVQTACDSFTWTDGNSYDTSNNTATHILTNSMGCDSLITLNLTLNNSTTGTDVQSVCDSYTWIDGNTYITSNNNATHILTNSIGCDSLVTLNLTINATAGIDIQSTCDSYIWIDGNTYYTSNNTATHTLINAAGCDSLVTLNLTINNPEVSLSISGIVITANDSTATYQWLDCNDSYSEIFGENNQSFTPTANGSYAVELINFGCVDTSGCVNITTVGIIENDFGSEFVVFPNPTNGEFTIDMGNSFSIVSVNVTDLSGKTIHSHIFNDTNLINISLDEPAGVYLLILQSGESKALIRLVKK